RAPSCDDNRSADALALIPTAGSPNTARRPWERGDSAGSSGAGRAPCTRVVRSPGTAAGRRPRPGVGVQGWSVSPEGLFEDRLIELCFREQLLESSILVF